MTLVVVLHCLVVRSTQRFHVLHGRSETGVSLPTADLRRNLWWTLFNTSLAEIKRVTLYKKNKSDKTKIDNLRNCVCQMLAIGKFQYRYMTNKRQL